MQAIVLAGGLGTRLRAALPEGMPKPLAPVLGRPFLAWLLDRLDAAGIERCVLAVGHRAEAIVSAIGHRHGRMHLHYSVEQSPLGTGGAIRLALAATDAASVVVLNGDTFLDVDYRALLDLHLRENASLTIACVRVPDVGRYGRVELLAGRVTGFREKGERGAGYINGGVYAMRRTLLDAVHATRFSFETDFLAPGVRAVRPHALTLEGRFIDIGIPDDLARAGAVLSAAAAKPAGP